MKLVESRKMKSGVNKGKKKKKKVKHERAIIIILTFKFE